MLVTSTAATMSAAEEDQQNGGGGENGDSGSAATLHLNYDYQNAQRFPAWMALTVFSAVCLAAESSQLKITGENSADKWVLSVTIVSMLLSLISVLAYLFIRHLYVANIPEMGLSFLLLGFWGAGLPVIMNPNRGIAVMGDDVVNANLYFFSWMSLATVVFICGHLLQEWTGLSAREVISANTSQKTGKWYGLAASSMVVMVSCVRIFVATNCPGDRSMYCRRTKFGISVGVLSFLGSIACACMLSKAKVTTFNELLATTVMLTFWCFGVGFITFGPAPGSKIGNLYFSCWISFIVIVMIFGQTFRDFLSGRSAAAVSAQQSCEESDVETPEIPADDEI